MALDSKFAELLNARPASWRLQSKAPEVDVCIERIAAVLRALYKRSPPKPRQLRAAIRWLLLNLLNVRHSDSTRYVAVKMGANAFRPGFGYRILKRAVTGMTTHGLVELHPGFRDRVTGKGYTTRLRATDRLVAICHETGVRPSMVDLQLDGPLVRLKSSKATGKRLLRWPRDEASQAELRRMTTNLRGINEFLCRSFVGLNVPDWTLQEINEDLGRKYEEHSWVDFSRKQLYRVFNDGNIQLGGRFVGGWWQNIPSDYRKHIHIAALAELPLWNVEVDYGSLQPTLLYLQEKTAPPADCYAINDHFQHSKAARNYAKTALLVMLNAVDSASAAKAIQDEVTQEYDATWRLEHPGERRPQMTMEQIIPEGCPAIPDLMGELAQYHAPIAKHFCTDVGKRLMYIESNIAESVILRMHAQGMTTLPVHDSFMVRKGNQYALKDAMRQVFNETMGADCEIRADETELDQYREWHGSDKDHWALVRNNELGLWRGELFDGMVREWNNQQSEIRRGYEPDWGPTDGLQLGSS